MILPGETEAGTAGRNHAEGYPGGLIETMNGGVRTRPCAAQPPSDRKSPPEGWNTWQSEDYRLSNHSRLHSYCTDQRRAYEYPR
jgi:hypothetical protein